MSERGDDVVDLYPKTVEQMIEAARRAIVEPDTYVVPMNQWSLDLCERLVQLERMVSEIPSMVSGMIRAEFTARDLLAKSDALPVISTPEPTEEA